MSAISSLTLALASVIGQPAPDYQLDPEPWNGLGYLATTATEAKVELTTTTSLDLAALAPDDTIILVYPTAQLPIEDLLAFVDTGGFLVVADDFGSTEPLLARAGIGRVPAPPPAPNQRLVEGQPGLPILTPAGEHFLFFRVEEVVANHPAALVTTSPAAQTVRPILSFPDGTHHLIAESPLGDGALLAIADPSILLNEMQRRYYGNKQLAANVLRYYCKREPCKATLLLPGGSFTGHFDAASHRLGTLPKDLREAIDALDESLADASEALATPPIAWFVVLAAAAVGIVLGLFAVARFRRPAAMPLPSMSPADLQAPALEEARGLVTQRFEADFGNMAETLANHGLDLIGAYDLEKLAHDPKASDLSPRDKQHLGDAVLRVRSEAASLHSHKSPVVPAERFLRLFADVDLLQRFARGRRRARPGASPATHPRSQRPPKEAHVDVR